ncbi:hypothetical protein KM043_007129 [Ampulex compressa]|nr:hypothetical protein KM043_007129 [Ampulex compressa]
MAAKNPRLESISAVGYAAETSNSTDQTACLERKEDMTNIAAGGVSGTENRISRMSIIPGKKGEEEREGGKIGGWRERGTEEPPRRPYMFDYSVHATASQDT